MQRNEYKSIDYIQKKTRESLWKAGTRRRKGWRSSFHEVLRKVPRVGRRGVVEKEEEAGIVPRGLDIKFHGADVEGGRMG